LHGEYLLQRKIGLELPKVFVDDITKHLDGKFAIAGVVPLVEGLAFLKAVQTEQKT